MVYCPTLCLSIPREWKKTLHRHPKCPVLYKLFLRTSEIVKPLNAMVQSLSSHSMQWFEPLWSHKKMPRWSVGFCELYRIWRSLIKLQVYAVGLTKEDMNKPQWAHLLLYILWMNAQFMLDWYLSCLVKRCIFSCIECSGWAEDRQSMQFLPRKLDNKDVHFGCSSHHRMRVYSWILQSRSKRDATRSLLGLRSTLSVSDMVSCKFGI